MKKIATLGITILLLMVVGLSGCQQQDEGEALISASLVTFSITKDDVPENFTKSGNTTHFVLDGDVTDDPIEHYRAWFENPGYIDPIDASNYTVDQYIYYELNKYVNIDMAIEEYESDAYYYHSDHTIINNSYNSIGDQSLAYLMYQDNVSWYLLYFRISNVVVSFYNVNTTYQLAYDLAKIVEQRIYDSLV